MGYVTYTCLRCGKQAKAQYVGRMYCKECAQKNKEEKKPCGTRRNIGIVEDAKKANELGISYGQYKAMQYMEKLKENDSNEN